jgi:APA family basic amino acid/polyamine antiporter
MSMLATPHEGPTTGEPAPYGFQQRLGLFDATMLVAGAMIGSGIFIVSADIARDVGTSGWLLVVWLLAGVMTIIGALSYAELAAMMPQAGGQYVYLREAYSPLWGFLYGWTLFLVIQTGTIAAVAVAFTKFLGVFVPALGMREKAGGLVLIHADLRIYDFKLMAGHCMGAGLIVVLTALNCLGVQQGKWVQNIFTVAKTVALAALIVLGVTIAWNADAIRMNTANWWTGAADTRATHNALARLGGGPEATPLLRGLAILMAVGGALTGSLFASDAWNNVTFTAGEVRNPRRTLPLSLALGTGMVILLYVLANVAYLVALPILGKPALNRDVEAQEDRALKLEAEARELERHGNKEAAEAAKKAAEAARDQADNLLASASTFDRGIAHAKDDRVGTAVMELVSRDYGAPLMAVAIMISTFGCVNGLILMGARLYYAMARDGLFFQAVGRLNRRGVPAAGLILQGIWAILLTFSGTYSQLLDYIIFAALLFYVLTVVGLFVLRRKQPQAERPYRAFGYPIIPAIYVLLCTVIMLDLLIVKPLYTWPGLIIVLTGFPVYFVWRRLARRRMHSWIHATNAER